MNSLLNKLLNEVAEKFDTTYPNAKECTNRILHLAPDFILDELKSMYIANQLLGVKGVDIKEFAQFANTKATSRLRMGKTELPIVSVTMNSPAEGGGLLPIRIEKKSGQFGNMYILSGKGLFEIKLKPYNGNRRPKYSKYHKGFIYSEKNKDKILLWFTRMKYLSEAGEQIFGGVITVAPRDKEYGVMGWDTPYTPSDWLKSILPAKLFTIFGPRGAPVKKKIGQRVTYYYDKNAVSSTCARKVMMFANKHGFPGVLPTQVFAYKGNIMNFDKAIQLLNTLKYSSMWVAWGNHARFAHIDNLLKTLTVFDPWKVSARGKNWDLLKRSFAAKGWNVVFDGRTKHTRDQIIEAARYGTVLSPSQNLVDQGVEGSCSVVSFMRAFMIEKYGKIGARLTPEEDIVYYTWLVTSYLR